MSALWFSVNVISFYLQGVKINTKLFSIKHGLEVLQTAVNTVQIVHQLYPDHTHTHTKSITHFHIKLINWHTVGHHTTVCLSTEHAVLYLEFSSFTGNGRKQNKTLIWIMSTVSLKSILRCSLRQWAHLGSWWWSEGRSSEPLSAALVYLSVIYCTFR